MPVRPALASFLLLATLAVPLPASPEEMRVLLFPTLQYAHQDIWTRTPNGRGPTIALADRVVRGQPVHLVVAGALFATDAGRQAEVSYQLTSTRPDGSPGNGTAMLKLVPRGVIADTRLIRMAAEQVVWIFGPDDPEGTWRIRLEANDAVSGAAQAVEREITLCGEDLLREPLPADTDVGRWLMAYHSRPAPHLLPAALARMAEQPPPAGRPRRDVENGAWLGFFEQVLADNPWLLPHLVAELATSSGRKQELLATSLAFAKRDDHGFAGTLEGPAREKFMKYRLQNWPVPGPEPTRGEQLDVLWGRFFASGRFRPIRELVGLLSYHPFRAAPDEYQNRADRPARPPVEFYKGVVFRALVWSLGSNIRQDKVVRDYCEGILLRKELPDAEHDWLAGIFASAMKERQDGGGRPPAAQSD